MTERFVHWQSKPLVRPEQAGRSVFELSSAECRVVNMADSGLKFKSVLTCKSGAVDMVISHEYQWVWQLVWVERLGGAV